jgi:acetylglutamate kinase|tara:strand:- start:3440 stop:4330 length:891 start_codon:yes stop_codon:yes gene_type:complete
MFSEINHSESDDRLERPQSMKSNDECVDQQPSASDVPINQQSLTVIKIGGSTLGSHDTTLMDLVELQKEGENFVVIHGGGKTISEWMEKQGVRPKFVNGLRVTDSQSLDIVVAVLTGVINKSLVASINALGGRAIGISGADGNMVSAEIADPELGYVGKIRSVDTAPIEAILEGGYIPVIAPVGIHSGSGHQGKLLNINADTVAGYVSSSINANRMVFLTDVEGVLDSSKRLISRMTKRQADSLVASHVIDGGMIPKMEACIEALLGGAISQIIDGRAPGALKDVISGHNLGTRIG